MIISYIIVIILTAILVYVASALAFQKEIIESLPTNPNAVVNLSATNPALAAKISALPPTVVQPSPGMIIH